MRRNDIPHVLPCKYCTAQLDWQQQFILNFQVETSQMRLYMALSDVRWLINIETNENGAWKVRKSCLGRAVYN